MEGAQPQTGGNTFLSENLRLSVLTSAADAPCISGTPPAISTRRSARHFIATDGRHPVDVTIVQSEARIQSALMCSRIWPEWSVDRPAGPFDVPESKCARIVPAFPAATQSRVRNLGVGNSLSPHWKGSVPP